MGPTLPFRRLRVRLAVAAAGILVVASARLAVTSLPPSRAALLALNSNPAPVKAPTPAPVRGAVRSFATTKRAPTSRPVATTRADVATEPQPLTTPMPSLQPPRPGIYTYKVSASGVSSADQLHIAAAPAGSTRQTLTDATENRSVTVDWSGRGVAMVAITQGRDTCELNAPMLLLPRALSVGLSWRASAGCDDGRAHIAQDASVRGIATTTVRGQRLRCWVISRHTLTTATSAAGTATAESQIEELFSPELGVVVYRATKDAAPAADGSVHDVTSTDELDAIDVR